MQGPDSMVKLERIVPGSRLAGVIGDDPVEILSARPCGPDAVEVTWRGPEDSATASSSATTSPVCARSHPPAASPSTVTGHRFRLASEALRIRLAHLFDPHVAVNASRIEPLPHQLTAVYGPMLDRQPLRFLLADDPGAGKTVMAGLLIKELRIRGSLERCLIIAPGSLVEQWQDELADSSTSGSTS